MDFFFLAEKLFEVFPPILCCPYAVCHAFSCVPAMVWRLYCETAPRTPRINTNLLKSGFYLLLWSVFARWSHWQLSWSAAAQHRKDWPATAAALAAKETLVRQTRLAWLFCSHRGSGDLQSLQTLPAAGPLHTPCALPLIASPSHWMTRSSLLSPDSETVPSLRWGQHSRSLYFQL